MIITVKREKSPSCSFCPPSRPVECVDTGLHSDLAADALDYEAESWSLTVEHKFCKKQDKRVVKRQDVIYGELTMYSEQLNHHM